MGLGIKKDGLAVEGVAEIDEWGSYYYTNLLNNPYNYKLNKLLDVGKIDQILKLFMSVGRESAPKSNRRRDVRTDVRGGAKLIRGCITLEKWYYIGVYPVPFYFFKEIWPTLKEQFQVGKTIKEKQDLKI